MTKSYKVILKSGLQSKYYIGLQSIVPGYPTEDDFVFECVNYTLTKNKTSLKEDGITFSKSSLKDVFGERLKTLTFLDSLKSLIHKMILDGTLLKPDETSLTIPIKTVSTLFSIK